ncbi:hypothetical protein FH972_023481 [Carpinus fangiana]|uniref:Zn(2)-C6 fungal-type domain-containing protein n=1 Tax=Carpinus fangiana TaxID=176857 RepID=A0A5N6KVA8_9ROSI|nr:hypothetical protein FH972_023481 [Carpinus fangiana]
MVGVSKKAGGCVTCRTRKVKCDGKLPICGPCSVKSRKCVPHSRDFIFVQSRAASGQRVYHQNDNGLISIKPFYEDQLLDHFLDQVLPSQRFAHDISQLSSYTWVEILPKWKHSSRTISGAICALATSVLGRQKSDTGLLTYSLLHYGKTLERFQQELYQPTAICSGRSTFLSQQRWREIPWLLSEKSQYHLLIDLMTFIPDTVQPDEVVSLGNFSYFSVDSRVRLINQCWNLERRLKKWYQDLGDEDSLAWISEATLELEADKGGCGRLFPYCYNFSSLTSAHLHAMYWASLLIIYDVLTLNYQALMGLESSYHAPEHPSALKCRSCCHIVLPLSHVGPSTCKCGFIGQVPKANLATLPSMTEEHAPQQFANKICMGMEYCLTADARLLGSQVTLFPLKVAIRNFMAEPLTNARRLKWCGGVVDLLESKGLSFDLKTMGFPISPTPGIALK